MPTIADVAREAGVSRSTVSAVLTGNKFVRPETRARIVEVIAQLNFSVNYGARALATSRTMTLGVVVQLHGGEFMPALAPFLVSLSDAARAEGYDVLLVTEADQVQAIHRLAVERKVDGVVLLNILDDDPRLAALREHALPAVLLGMPNDPGRLDAVDLDFEAGARLLVQHLRHHGHRHALFIRWGPDMFDQRNSFVLRFNDAALVEADRAGLKLDLVDCPVVPEEIPAALTHALSDRGSATAVLVHNDAATALLPSVLHATGLTVPDDLSVVSLHSAELAGAFALPFTSVETMPDVISGAAIRTLVDRITGDTSHEGAPRHHLVAPRLTDRASVGTK